MEWVEIAAKTVDEARDLALDQLGVDEQDAEIEVLEEPKQGFFGKLRGQARVRARVAPAQVRPKVERRDRGRRRGGNDRPASVDSPKETVTNDNAPSGDEERPARPPRRRGGGGGGGRGDGGGRGRVGREGGSGRPATHEPGSARGEEGADMPELTIDEQAEAVAGFLRGLAERFGVEGSETEIERVEEDTVEIRLAGGDLGLLIGPKGQTLHLVQELARTMVQRRGGGTQEGRIRIDIAGYRQRRRDALERFTQQVAAQVLDSGSQKALEPMNPADRKVVHDTVNGIDGVRTVSEGEEPRRRVVLLPD